MLLGNKILKLIIILKFYCRAHLFGNDTKRSVNYDINLTKFTFSNVPVIVFKMKHFKSIPVIILSSRLQNYPFKIF